MENRELRDLLVKVEDMRWNESLTSDDLDSIARLLKGELDRKSDRPTGPAIGQKYWACPSMRALHLYNADDYDLNVRKLCDIYPEERFAEAELRARKLIVSVNKRRRELNEGKEFGDRKCYIVFGASSGVVVWRSSDQAYVRGDAYPFGLFKDIADCITCIDEFKDELDWFYKEYIPLMAELDDYDWAEAPGWGDEV